MDPRKSRFSPYEVRGGPGGGRGGRGGFRGGNQAPPQQQQQQQQQQRDDFYGRDNGFIGEPRRNMFNNDRGMSGGGGPMMRTKASRFQPQQQSPQQQQQQQQQQHNDFLNTSNMSRSSFNSASSYHTAAPRRTGPSRWEPKKESWDDDRVSLNNDDNRRRSVEKLPSHIEQRVAREKPCRTLFVRNIQYNLKAHEIKEMYEKFGEVKEVFNLIESRGMVFVTFYDIRAAEKAKEATQGMFLANRRIDVHYSLPKEEEENAKCDRTKNQGTLLFTLKNTEAWLQDDQLYDYFSRFGEVKVIRTPHFKHHTENNERRQRFVEFHDSRACVDAFDSCHGKEYKGGRWDVSFFWDHTNRERSEAFAAKKERPTDARPGGRSDRRDNDRRRGGRDFSRSRRHFDDDRRGSHDDYGRGSRFSRSNNRSISPRGGDRHYNPEIPSYTSNEDNQRLEQAQKAQQQLLNIFARKEEPNQDPRAMAQPLSYPPVQQQQQPYPAHPPPAAGVPMPPAVQQQQPQAAAAANDQTAQLQQVLGFLTQMAAQQQQQQQQQHQQQQQYQQPVQQQPPAIPPPAMPSQPPSVPTTAIDSQQQQQQPQQAPITDPAAALSQLAQILQSQQQQQPQQQSPYPPVSSVWNPDQTPQ